ncbi:uncharacterized protein F4822DRAFT_441988 [Hypoxylon trugodes]|uniref:uncharacterized protein n=1 Tax=Hypoxylon trugodes TaxID=326681 RepID=UPI002194FEC9|nr:uncharacterized protein F4822DRAFT_441988 [Hypoxylon trugodes]KAI1390703.1 hypothetical protein F4822DRAFT_441988 [Hypoxylon trugodes]
MSEIPEMPEISQEEMQRELFGPLMDIPEKALVELASNISERVFHKKPTSEGNVISRIVGSYNIVHIVQLGKRKFVIRVPCTGWGAGKTDTAARALESQVATMRLVARITWAVPEVYDYDATDQNAIGAPYICMSFVSGTPVSEVWFKYPEGWEREIFRFNILRTLTEVMAQFSKLSFDRIGSVVWNGTKFTASRPCYDWKENEDGTVGIVSSGPFDSVQDYLKANSKESTGDEVWNAAETAIMVSAMRHSPILNSSTEGFVLSPPDFDSQNIMVDQCGNVIAIIDWDLAQTLPRCVGFARFPGWITRDMNPLMYGWPRDQTNEDPPHRLMRYRHYYNKELGRQLGQKGDWKFTVKSQLTKALWIAALHSQYRLEICRKFVQYAWNIEFEKTLDVLFDIGARGDDDDDQEPLDLDSKMQKLMALEPKEDASTTNST